MENEQTNLFTPLAEEAFLSLGAEQVAYVKAINLPDGKHAIGIFSAYMLYDVNRIVTGGETNYITATLALYLDVYNVFVNLLSLLGFMGGSND